jgi:hypothetical protein
MFYVYVDKLCALRFFRLTWFAVLPQICNNVKYNADACYNLCKGFCSYKVCKNTDTIADSQIFQFW